MKFSIITPIYNRADCVSRCIESVINQICSHDKIWECEHIVVNDGSNDNTNEILNKYSENFPHIVYINFVENKGTNAARNAAIKAATGDYCIILDSDDYFVNNALDIISNTIQRNSGYKHYMFTPDDRKKCFDNNSDLCTKKIITYKDFLSQKYSGDFIHVIQREILQNNPFDETLRIYEGVFFMRFYKEAQNIYFENIVVTIRERGRVDSATKEYIKIKNGAIKNSIKAIEINLEWFKKDYIGLGLTNNINNLYVQLLNNYLLIGNYQKCREIINILNEDNYKIPFNIKIIYHLRFGGIYRAFLYTFLQIKYNIFKTKIK